MKITFLGTGTSQGVPLIGCDCAVCCSDDPRDKRFRCSILVEGPSGTILVDTTPDLRSQALRVGLKRVDAVLMTHGHADHLMGFDDLRRLSDPKTDEIPIYANGMTLDILARVFFYLFNGQNRYRGYVHPVPHLIEEPLELCGLRIVPLPVPHGKVETWGYRFEEGGVPKFAYISDAKEIPQQTRHLVQGIPVLVLDGLRPESHPTHLSLPEAVQTAREVEAQEVYFTHLTHYLPHAATEASLPQGMHLAYDTLTLDL